jgi:HEAT repeat protein
LNGLLLENDMLLAVLADPQTFTQRSAVALAKSLSLLDPQLDAKLLKQFMPDDGEHPYSIDSLERVLEIVDAVSDGKRLVPFLMKLQRHKESRIRSKVALILVRANRNTDWLAEQLSDDDPRIRANAIEGMLETQPGEKEVAQLWEAAGDAHHRVATTSLLVLIKNGHRKAWEDLMQLTKHSSELFRAAAAWAMGMTGDPEFLNVLQKMVRGDSGAATRMALKASVMIRKNQISVPVDPVDPVEPEPQAEAGAEPDNVEVPESV